jgi:hypothetical protein
MDTEINIISLLKNEPKEPFSININIENANLNKIFQKLKNIYAQGLNIQVGEMGDKLNITKVEKKHMEVMKAHMLSMGIDVKYKTYSKKDKDCLFREFLYDIQYLDGVNAKVTTDWKKNIIERIELRLEVKKMETLNKFEYFVRRNFKSNHFLKFMKPKELRDYAIFIKKPDEDLEHIIYFDFAKRTDNIRRKIYAYQNLQFQ